jgi:Arc/MetJ-type ribon-helix-helix transcriptional regulator
MKSRISATIDKESLKLIDEIMKSGKYRNKSHVIEEAIREFVNSEKQKKSK